jgi:hypothetical protein
MNFKSLALGLATAALAVTLAQPAAAQTLKSLKAEPASAKPGEAVSITAEFDTSKALNCNVRVSYGDGKSENRRINKAEEAKLALSHTYAKPGNYTVKVEPKTDLPVLKCLGKAQSTKVAVVAPPPVAGAGPSCPEGWTLDPKSVSKKTGAYACKAKAGTALPAAKPACPAKLKYHEDAKKGVLGCRA